MKDKVCVQIHVALFAVRLAKNFHYISESSFCDTAFPDSSRSLRISQTVEAHLVSELSLMKCHSKSWQKRDGSMCFERHHSDSSHVPTPC